MKLLVTDLDGTLYPKNKELLKENILAIQEWKNKGNVFAVATARGVGHYNYLAELLGFKPNFFGGNGAENIYEDGSVKLKSFSIAVFFDLCEYLQELGIDASVSTIHDCHWYWNSKNNYPIYASNKPRWEHVEVITPYSISKDTMIERIAVFAKEENIDGLKSKIIKRYSSIVNVTTSDKDTIDLGPLGSSKGISIIEFAKRIGINCENIITIGDSENDVPMFDVAYRSYCIDHASKDVANRATYTVASVAEAIKQELLL